MIEIKSASSKIWKPAPGRQEEFLSLPDSIQEALYGGALGGGKTLILLMLPIARGLYQHPRFNGIVFRRTFPEVEESLIPKSKEYYPLVGGKYNDTKHAWYFPSGAVIRFGYMDIDDDVRKHDGSEYSYIAYDELEHFTEYMYLQLHARNRSPIKELPKIVRCTAMPGGIGHSWVRKRFVEPFVQGGKILLDKQSGNKRIFIPAKLTDNPFLHQDDPDYINRLRNLPLAEQKAKIDGDWWAFLGQVFDEFRIRPYPDEPDNARHVVKPFDIPEWWPRLAAIDWGFTHKTSIHKAALSPDQRVIIYFEQIAQKEYISSWASKFRRSCQNESFVTIEMDPSAWQKRGDEKTIAEQVQDITGFTIQRADNDRIGGKMLFHEMLRWKPRPPKYIPNEGYNTETENRIWRLYGDNARNEYRKMFEPDAIETNIPRLQIFDTCKELIQVIPSLVYDASKKDGAAEDVLKFDGDDAYDSCRYLLKAVDRYINLCKREADKRAELGRIIHDVEVTGNQTAFYRRMAKFENEERRKNRPVRLYH